MYESRDNFVYTALKHKVADNVQRKMVGDLAYLWLLSLYGHILVNYLTKIYLLEFFEVVELLPILLKKFVDVLDVAGNLFFILLLPLDQSPIGDCVILGLIYWKQLGLALLKVVILKKWLTEVMMIILIRLLWRL